VVKSRIGLQLFLNLLKEIELFVEKKNKRIEELDDKGWLSDLGGCVCVCVTGHLITLNNGLQSKDKFITKMFDSIKAFKISLRLWENQLKVHNLEE
jgi:hypothetical protein